MFLRNSAGGNILKPWPVVGAAEFWETPKHIMESYRVLQYLVGGLEHFLFFHLLGNNHPNWLSYASEGFVYHQPDRVSQYGFTTYRRYGFHQMGFWNWVQVICRTKTADDLLWPSSKSAQEGLAGIFGVPERYVDSITFKTLGRWNRWSWCSSNWPGLALAQLKWGYIYIEPTS